MSFEFKFNSSHFTTDGLCNKIVVELVIPRIYGDETPRAEIEYIWDETAERERKFNEFPPEERERILILAELAVQDAGCLSEPDPEDGAL